MSSHVEEEFIHWFDGQRNQSDSVFGKLTDALRSAFNAGWDTGWKDAEREYNEGPDTSEEKP